MAFEIPGYKRNATKFDWCGTTIWLIPLTEADEKRLFGPEAGEQKGRWLEVIARCLANEKGELILTDLVEAEAYFRDKVSLPDFIALGKLCMKHTGYDMDKVRSETPDEPEKKS